MIYSRRQDAGLRVADVTAPVVAFDMAFCLRPSMLCLDLKVGKWAVCWVLMPAHAVARRCRALPLRRAADSPCPR
jgi:hypothetical protein